MPILATKGAGSAQGFGFSGGLGSTCFICATGGTVTTSGDYKIHTFTGPGTFKINKNIKNPVNAKVDYLVVAGGGAGALGDRNGAGGAGGFRESVPSPAAWTASPLASPGGALPVSVQSYPITVGAGGAGVGPAPDGVTGNSGSNSIFSTITSTGGGGGGGTPSGPGGAIGLTGGSGGGGGLFGLTGPGVHQTPNAAGNTPPVSPPQGNPGGYAELNANAGGGGGGGATAAGCNAIGAPPGRGGAGGAGATTSISASPTAYAGGGGGSGDQGPKSGGTGGGGAGGTPGNAGTPGTINTGGGGGGGGNSSPNSVTSASGGSGIVVIRYKFQ